MAAFLAPHGALPATRVVMNEAAEGSRILRSAWGAGARPLVVLLTVEGGGHVWFGGRRAEREGAAHDLSASGEIVRFFGAWR
jgi:poly(3-hydroxybutyrate) depolymerase